jgi:hypothetical protein
MEKGEKYTHCVGQLKQIEGKLRKRFFFRNQESKNFISLFSFFLLEPWSLIYFALRLLRNPNYAEAEVQYRELLSEMRAYEREFHQGGRTSVFEFLHEGSVCV